LYAKCANPIDGIESNKVSRNSGATEILFTLVEATHDKLREQKVHLIYKMPFKIAEVVNKVVMVENHLCHDIMGIQTNLLCIKPTPISFSLESTLAARLEIWLFVEQSCRTRLLSSSAGRGCSRLASP